MGISLEHKEKCTIDTVNARVGYIFLAIYLLYDVNAKALQKLIFEILITFSIYIVNVVISIK